MPKTLIRNIGINPVSIPPPYYWVLRGGQSFCIDDAVADVAANLGGPNGFAGVFDLSEVVDANPTDIVGVGSANHVQLITLAAATVSASVRSVTGQLLTVGGELAAVKDVTLRLEPSDTVRPFVQVFTGTSQRNEGNVLWMQTNSGGLFVVHVTHTVPGETVLVRADSVNASNSIMLQF